MKRVLLCIIALCAFGACAELDHAGDVLLREVSSVNVDNPQVREDMGALPEYYGEDVKDGNP